MLRKISTIAILFLALALSLSVHAGYANANPNASFTYSCDGLDCSFMDQSTDSDGTIVERAWNFGDGETAGSPNPSHTYAAAGTYNVILSVTDDYGGSDSVTRSVSVSAAGNQAPAADFTFSCTNLDCSFTDQSTDADGAVDAWSWNFGDGSSSSEQNPSHTYNEGGSYSVVLSVTDNDGSSDSRARTVSVSGEAATFLINAGITDAWFSPLTDGQGFFIIVWEENGLIFLSWFTYDTERPPQDVNAILGEPGHRWLTAQGPFTGDMATLDVYLTAGGRFDTVQPAPETSDPIGTITIVWTGCNSGTLAYDLPSLGLSGSIDIERIVLVKVPDCEAAQPHME
jgi:PKD repeat protein